MSKISDHDHHILDEVKSYYFYLSKYPILQIETQIVVLSLLLELTRIYAPLFVVKQLDISKPQTESFGWGARAG
ncbi:MAG: hypothetical protein ACK47D_16975, partial [Pseudanabaena sp.]